MDNPVSNASAGQFKGRIGKLGCCERARSAMRPVKPETAEIRNITATDSWLIQKELAPVAGRFSGDVITRVVTAGTLRDDRCRFVVHSFDEKPPEGDAVSLNESEGVLSA
jgi:hypothetical protein